MGRFIFIRHGKITMRDRPFKLDTLVICQGSRHDTIGFAIENNLRFPGQYYDQETGEHYNNNRYYNSIVGRYTSVDMVGKNTNVISYQRPLRDLMIFAN